jgi:seryl-tRNA synthetase
VLDIKLLRSQPEQVQELLNRRGGNYDLSQILELDSQIRELETQRSRLQAESNEIGKQVGQLMRSLKQSGGDHVSSRNAQGKGQSSKIGDR